MEAGQPSLRQRRAIGVAVLIAGPAELGEPVIAFPQPAGLAIFSALYFDPEAESWIADRFGRIPVDLIRTRIGIAAGFAPSRRLVLVPDRAAALAFIAEHVDDIAGLVIPLAL